MPIKMYEHQAYQAKTWDAPHPQQLGECSPVQGRLLNKHNI